jgi:hypothetical protein
MNHTERSWGRGDEPNQGHGREGVGRENEPHQRGMNHTERSWGRGRRDRMKEYELHRNVTDGGTGMGKGRRGDTDREEMVVQGRVWYKARRKGRRMKWGGRKEEEKIEGKEGGRRRKDGREG